MTEPKSENPWPDYLPLPREDIYAIGVIALNYCQLENVFRAVFKSVSRWNEHQIAAIFHRMANNIRKDVLSELVPKTTIPAESKERIGQFLIGFGICADNRNFIMHSSSGGMYSTATERGLVLERYSKAGKRLVCDLTLADLRRVADEIHAYSNFGSWLLIDVENYAMHLERGHPEDFRPLSWRTTLQKIPPPPVPLNWQIPDDPKERGPRNPALQLISAWRIHDRGEGPGEG